MDEKRKVVEMLPGSDDRSTTMIALAKAILRILKLSDFADAVADITGISRKKLDSMIKKSLLEMESVSHEYKLDNKYDFRPYVQEYVLESFKNAARQRIASTALMNADSIEILVKENVPSENYDRLSTKERGYAEALIQIMAEQVHRYYTEDEKLRSFAVGEGIGTLLRESKDVRETNTRLNQTLEKIESQLTRQKDNYNWNETGGDNKPRVVQILPRPDDYHMQHVKDAYKWIRWGLEFMGYEVAVKNSSQESKYLTIIVADEDVFDHRKRDKVEFSEVNLASNANSIIMSFSSDMTWFLNSQEIKTERPLQQLRDILDPRIAGRWTKKASYLEYENTSNISKLKTVSTNAITEAGRIGTLSFETDQLSTSLYVERDLEDDLLTKLKDFSYIVVSGEAGSGKTSLLWGIAQKLMQKDEHDVYFIKSSYLIASMNDSLMIDGEQIAQAVLEQGPTRQTIVLLDTADVLLSDERHHIQLENFIETVIHCGAKIIVTSRPLEADKISIQAGYDLFLSSYSMEPSSDNAESEFVRAVKSHAMRFCAVPGDTVAIANQLLAVVVREVPLGEVARRPLMLRMLFELYRPGTIPEHISATMLYTRYWKDRIASDKRSHGHRLEASNNSRDLGTTATRLAIQMLERGIPEASVEILCSSLNASIDLEDEIRELCKRGVGKVNSFGIFSFFHQTYFEYVSAREFTRYSGGLSELVRRSSSRPDDYFISPVVEQAWVLAYSDPLVGPEAESLMLKIIRDSEPFNMRRIIRVLGQISMSKIVSECFTDLIPAFKSDHVREYLRLLPRPHDTWKEYDTNLLKKVLSGEQSGNSYRNAVLEVLLRLALMFPERTKLVIDSFDEVTQKIIFSDKSLREASTRSIVSILSLHSPDWILEKISSYTWVFACKFLELFASSGVAPSPTSSSIFLELLRNNFESRSRVSVSGSSLGEFVAEILQAQDNTDLSELWSEVLGSATVHSKNSHLENQEKSSKKHSGFDAYNSILFSALLMNVAKLEDFEIHVFLKELFDENLPELHIEVHSGAISVLLNNSEECRNLLAETLARGLPAHHHSPIGPNEKWADSIRRALVRPEIQIDAFMNVIEKCQKLMLLKVDMTDLWVDGDNLIYIILHAGNAGHPDALEILKLATNADLEISPEQLKIISRQSHQIFEAGPGFEHIVSFLAANHAWAELSVLLKNNLDAFTGSKKLIISLLPKLLKYGSVKNLDESLPALLFLHEVLEKRLTPFPSWCDMNGLFEFSKLKSKRIIATILVNGVIDGVYENMDVYQLLKEWVSLENDRDLRCQLIRLISSRMPFGEFPHALALITDGPCDTGLIMSLTPYLNGRLAKDLLSPPEINTIFASVGALLLDPVAPNSATRDVPGYWKDTIGIVLKNYRSKDIQDLLSIVVRVHPIFGRALVGRMPIPDSLVRNQLSRIRDDAEMDDALVRVVDARLASAPASSSSLNEWPGVQSVLHSLASR